MQLRQQFGKVIPRLTEVAPQRSHGREVSTRCASQSEINPSRIHRGQRSKLLGHHERSMVGQHDSSAAYPNRGGRAGDVPDQYRGRRTRQAFNRMMFGQPETSVSETLHVPRQLNRARNRTSRRLALPHANQIKNRDCQSIRHTD